MSKRGNQKVSEVFSHFFKCILDKYALRYNKNYAYTQTQETRHKGFFYEPFGPPASYRKDQASSQE
jgi:hypothetical protein